ncbi:hypothetical protein EGM51_10580 [Verrucomicrobia bacterium S94]|nr:hypothetical protein EGM51_10580 [Verrucomicrobia bacterium S94]
MIAYFKGKSLVSRLIKWRTWGDYSHVAWIVDRDFSFMHHGRHYFIPAGTIYESWHRKAKGASRRGVRKGVAGDLHTPGTEVDLEAIPLSDAKYIELILYFERKAADPKAKYGFRGVISGFTLRADHAHGRDSVFCSQLIMQGFRQIGYLFLKNIMPYQTSPVDMSHSPVQMSAGKWKTGTPWVRNGRPVIQLKEGLR